MFKWEKKKNKYLHTNTTDTYIHVQKHLTDTERLLVRSLLLGVLLELIPAENGGVEYPERTHTDQECSKVHLGSSMALRQYGQQLY